MINSAFGPYKIERFPYSQDSSLRAWDSADIYILENLKERSTIAGPILLVNDSYGALHCSLREYSCDHLQDSWTSNESVEHNLNLNGITDKVETLKEKSYSTVLIKIPKTLSLLEYQLRKIRPLLTKDSVIIAGAMTRHIHNSTVQCFESIIGPSPTSLAQKKARLIYPSLSSEITLPPWEEYTSYTVEGLDLTLQNGPNVFSREKLDKGTAVLINFLPNELPETTRIADFGCGNGVISLAAAKKFPKVEIYALDDSASAVESARLNLAEYQDRVHLFQGNTLNQLPGMFDLILSNPPFHQGQRMDITPSIKFFEEAAEKLNSQGELRIVANRHLGYHSHLNRIFGNCRTLREQKGYLILSARIR
ncbi:MAG: methyltransferase [Spirochaetaceae bacterium]|jgi:23S rRNA (guanine1835-N2)-methyltransferase|nr:methyltransferase [Spirochaetaceae bacterium]